MKAQNKVQSACDVSVYSDKGSLALRFPKRHSALWELLDGKSLKGKPKCLGIGKYGYSDTPEDWKRASHIAAAMEADLDHPEWDKLFDPTLAKYGLGGGKYTKLADVLQMPGTVAAGPEMTVGQMWESYLEWKEGQVEPSTFMNFKVIYTNAIKGLKWNKRTHVCTDSSIWEEPVSSPGLPLKAKNLPIGKENQNRILMALSEACELSLKSGATTNKNPFKDLWRENKEDTRNKYKSIVTTDGETLKWWQIQDAKLTDKLEADKRAFNKEERDIIIKAFYESEKASERQVAPLIEFLFLTGCRPGEAFALTWGDIKFSSGILWFSKALGRRTKQIQVTKNKTIRMFKLYPRLTALLTAIKPVEFKPDDLLFKQKSGKIWYTEIIHSLWADNSYHSKQIVDTVVSYPGVVTRLVNEGKISQYLPPYHTRHTYITLTAWANKGDTSALMLLAHACENSVEIILAHYLGVNEEVELIQP